MRFDQRIWDSLVNSILKGYPGGYAALAEYADACDGTVNVNGKGLSATDYQFIPKGTAPY
jgi:hypothetical protein